ncbi:alkaline phosphatase PhoX [Gilvimarinus sp. DA14]|uniref:alkaline phosphatase PhoX n=1 Tax=Gilvimarinus sp. DA14 TaxID=2956798 RepID=UPI0020B82342|nr:alkaline phosphatase PhoX [Gilvimarinus sp. DA14]UTF60237.1 PhoX family protein [Gilvimarinus sp. DA14]
MQITRRHFLRNASAAAMAFGAVASPLGRAQVYSQDPTYGIDPFGQLVGDPAGILHLPRGFSYTILSRTGDTMSDGLITPSAPDGMAAFPVAGKNSHCILVRNHELDSLGNEVDAFSGNADKARAFTKGKAFDHYQNDMPVNGGTSNILYNLKTQKIERSHLSLIGTARNCAGGATPWGSWLTCEESLLNQQQGFGREHGFIFEVPSSADSLVDPVPLKDMGRFVHEAAAVDSQSGIIYLTEDFDHSLFYRFKPNAKEQLAFGGQLQALAITDWPGAITRNWNEDKTNPKAQHIEIGQSFNCHWQDLSDVQSPEGDLSLRGAAQGCAEFSRCEGVAFALRENGEREIFFAATGGGPKKIGQIWRYRPGPYEGTAREKEAPGQLTLMYETHDRSAMESCDNLAIAPWGDLIICEDSYSDSPDMVNYIRGMTPQGKIYTLAMNAHPDKGEFCGACFSPDGSTLFVNIQRPGFTLAITGPWGKLRNS